MGLGSACAVAGAEFGSEVAFFGWGGTDEHEVTRLAARTTRQPMAFTFAATAALTPV